MRLQRRFAFPSSVLSGSADASFINPLARRANGVNRMLGRPTQQTSTSMTTLLHERMWERFQRRRRQRNLPCV